MRVLVFGHSDTHGLGLNDRNQAWPRLLEAQLENASFEQAAVIHRRLNLLRPGPLEYLDAELEMHDPSVVVLALTSVTFSLPLVSVSVRRRFGARAAKRYLRFEGVVTGALPSAAGAKRADVFARWLARRLLGQATHMSVATATEMHLEVLRRLSAHEGLRVVVISASLLAQSFQQREPWANAQIHAFNGALHERAEEYRMEWVDFEELLARSGDHLACYSADGVHKSEFGHRHIAREMAAVLASAPVPQGRPPDCLPGANYQMKRPETPHAR